MNVIVINIGNELLSGKTVNTNLVFLGERLMNYGLEISEVIISPDEKEFILKAMQNIWKEPIMLIITGGLGPTKDDLTKDAVAEFFHKKMIFYEDIYEDIKERFAQRKIEMPEINRVQAMVPEGFIPLHNSLGTAPGLMYEENESILFMLPGVPFEMKHLFETHIVSYIKDKLLYTDYFCQDINTYDISESKIAEELAHIIPEQDVNIAWLPHTGRVDIRVYGKNRTGCEKVIVEINKILKDKIWGINEKSPAELLHKILIQKKLSISTAESCTGGMIASTLVANSGSSAYFLGAIIAYHNDVKNNILDVPSDIIDKYGAVSEECVRAMVNGCQKKIPSDIVCAVSGITGPTGGSLEKPVGTVYVGVSYLDKIIIEKCFFTGNREVIRQKVVDKAIMMVVVSDSTNR